MAHGRWLAVLPGRPQAASHAARPSTSSLARSPIDIPPGFPPRSPKWVTSSSSMSRYDAMTLGPGSRRPGRCCPGHALTRRAKSQALMAGPPIRTRARPGRPSPGTALP